jgi:CheY-like chemotaxis protein
MGYTKARILHVDDNPDTRLLIAASLAEAHYGVITAACVEEAVKLAEEVAFDLFILDVRLPDGTGIELCQRLHKLQPDVPTVYYSAYADDADQEAALSVCGDAYLRKPVCFADLEEVVVRLLANRIKHD